MAHAQRGGGAQNREHNHAGKEIRVEQEIQTQHSVQGKSPASHKSDAKGGHGIKERQLDPVAAGKESIFQVHANHRNEHRGQNGCSPEWCEQSEHKQEASAHFARARSRGKRGSRTKPERFEKNARLFDPVTAEPAE